MINPVVLIFPFEKNCVEPSTFIGGSAGRILSTLIRPYPFETDKDGEGWTLFAACGGGEGPKGGWRVEGWMCIYGFIETRQKKL